jgi:hypothetical protein
MAAGRAIARARPVEPSTILSPAEAQRIAGLRTRAASRVQALRDDLDELAAALGGRLPATRAAAGAVRPRISYYTSLLSDTLRVPAVSADQGTPAILEALAQYGLRERSFDKVVPVTAPQAINDSGSSYDAGAVYDAWILNPSVDCKFDFEKLPSQNTPFISANSRMQFQVRAQKVYYLGQNAGLVGTLQIWLLKFAGT